MKVRIVTDSTADFTNEEISKYNIDVVPLNVMFGSDVYRDGVDITSDVFYGKLVEAKELPTTSQPAPGDFLTIFEKAKENNESVVAICISSEISGTFQQSAQLAKNMCEYEHIHLVDSRQAAISLKILVLQAISMRDEGYNVEEIAKFIEENKERATILAYVDTLDYLVKGGRVPKTVGLAGNLLSVKPIITLTDGKVNAFSMARGKKSALQKLLTLSSEMGIDETLPMLYAHTTPEKIGIEAREFFVGNGYKSADVVTIGAAIGTHAGPGAVAIAFFKK